MVYPAKSLTKPLISPDWKSGNIYLYTPDTTAATLGNAIANPNYTVTVQEILTTFSSIFGTTTTASPNVCALYGANLFFTNNSADPQAVFGVPNYLGDPVTAQANAFVLDLYGSAYQGLAFDPSGNLYVCIQDYNSSSTGWAIVQYAGAGAATSSMQGEGVPIVLVGDSLAGQANFGNLAFDALGNLWATDYANDRLVVIAATALGNPGKVTAWAALANSSSGAAGPFPVANTVSGLNSATRYLFASPEGLDFDGFGTGANLWVANNNDNGNALSQENLQTSVVEITANLLGYLVTQLSDNPGTTVYATTRTAGTDYNIYQVPNYKNVLPQFGGLQVDKAANRLYVNDEAGGWVRGYDISALAATPNDSTLQDSQVAPIGVVTPYPLGNGGIALVQLGCYVQDDSSDTGGEPDDGTLVAPNVAWESPGIVASIDHGSSLTTLPTPADDPAFGAEGTDTILGGITRYIYVQVNYTSAMPSTGLEQLQLYWAKASTTLQWPAPWDGSDPVDPLMGLPVGGPIGSPITIPSVVGTPFGQTPPPFIAGRVAWAAPNPADYEVQDGHFCLLARIVTPNTYYAENTFSDPSLTGDTSIGNFAGMTVPEGSDLSDNVVANARIAWRNIHIITLAQAEALGGTSAGPYITFPHGVVATNFGTAPLHLRFGFDLLDERRRIIREPGGRLLVSATGRSLAVLERGSLGRLSHEDARRPGHRHDAVPHIATGIERLRLEPRETLIFHIDYEPPPGLRHYAIRASAFAQEAGGERLIGGQTFVYGEVEGFSRSR